MYTESIHLETSKRVSKYKVIKVEEVYPLSQQIISNFDSEFILNFLLDANEVFHYGYKPSEGEKENSVLHDITELLRNGVFPWIKNPEEGVLYLSKAFLSVYDNNASDGFKTMIELLNEAYINEILNENTSPAMGNRYRSGIDLLKTIHRFFVNIENQ